MFNRKRKIRRYLNSYGNSPVKTGKIKQKRIRPKTRRIKKAFVFSILTTISILIIWWIFFSSFFSITSIQLAENELSTESLSNEIAASGKSAALGKNIIFFNTDDIKKEILESHPQLEEVKVKKRYPETILIEFAEFPMVANVINESSTIRKSFVINSVGFAIKEDAENPQLPTIRVQTDEPVNVENALIQSENLKIMLDTKTYFEEKFGMGVKEIIYKPVAREFHLLTARDFAVWLDIQKSPEDQLTKLKKILVKLDIYSENLEYIDLRIAGNNGDKIIYKRR